MPPELYPLILTLLLSLISVAGGVIAHFLKDIRASFQREQREQNEEIDGLRDDLAELKASLPHQYVIKDDFVREISGLHHKIDRIGRDISDINRALGKLVGGGSQ